MATHRTRRRHSFHPSSFIHHPSEAWPERLAWALVSGALASLAAWAATKTAGAAWRRLRGRPPPQGRGIAGLLGWSAGRKGVEVLLH